MLSIDNNILWHGFNADSPQHETAYACFPSESLPMHESLWRAASKEGFAFRRLYDVRTALSLLAQGVTEFATANTKDFTGLGFRRVWNPLVS